MARVPLPSRLLGCSQPRRGDACASRVTPAHPTTAAQTQVLHLTVCKVSQVPSALVGPMSCTCEGPMVFVHAVCGLHHLCTACPSLHAWATLMPHAARVCSVKAACCACPLHAPHTGCALLPAKRAANQLACPARVASKHARSLRGLQAAGHAAMECGWSGTRVCWPHACRRAGPA